ncbi:AlpA family transcriptional regulator [Burkholderia pseudomallei]|uniref:helix-turn-helix transcriptional regulator n=1 Tax=Burkholderia pseudomallei TaxID=28450 RepID=UPI0015941503|nr:AlpA family transcriptional regulator [Burkholderia pseudomallei]NVH69329.1 AlpA family transcriptional regulator [Burkholderia pseudomallei]
MENRILRVEQVLTMVPLKKSTIYKHMQAGIFPRPIKIGPKAVGWLYADIQQWINDRVAASRAQ